MKRNQTAINAAIAELQGVFGDRIDTGEVSRAQHANVLTWIESQPPDAVVWPSSIDEVVAIVRIAASHDVAVTPFGAGTSLEGHVNAPFGGICVDMSRMNRIKAVHASDLDCVVEAGVTRHELDQAVRELGLFFAVDPGAGSATLAGMAATRASGSNAVRYGTMRNNVINITAVMADGSVVRTGGRARKSAAGYDLASLLIGSEGTLGIITELTVKLHPIPASVMAAVCPFASLAGACDATIEASAGNLGLTRVELLDGAQLRAINRHSGFDLEEVPTLFVEFQGSAAATADQVQTFRSIALKHGAKRFDWAANREERDRLWEARHQAYWAARAAYPDKAGLVSDVCVPVSRLADCVTETERDIQTTGLTAPIVGHVGDGNFHCLVLFDAGDAGEQVRVHAFLERLALRAIAMGGTCTGEHGIGQGKQALLEREISPEGVAVMRAVKQALDPQNILNPGKIFAFNR